MWDTRTRFSGINFRAKIWIRSKYRVQDRRRKRRLWRRRKRKRFATYFHLCWLVLLRGWDVPFVFVFRYAFICASSDVFKISNYIYVSAVSAEFHLSRNWNQFTFRNIFEPIWWIIHLIAMYSPWFFRIGTSLLYSLARAMYRRSAKWGVISSIRNFEGLIVAYELECLFVACQTDCQNLFAPHFAGWKRRREVGLDNGSPSFFRFPHRLIKIAQAKAHDAAEGDHEAFL